jgi:hypothetical protein
MASIRRLLPVIDGEGDGEALADQVVRVAAEALRAVELREAAVAASQVELRAERLAADAVEELVHPRVTSTAVSGCEG